MSGVGRYARLAGDAMRSRLATVRAAQSQSYESKRDMALRIIDECAEQGKIAIMFSGGRDSVAVAELAKAHNPALVYSDTGLSAKGARERVQVAADKLGLELHVVEPETTAYEMWQTLGHYPIGPKRGHTYLKEVTGISTSPVQCCYHLKEKPTRTWLRKHQAGSIMWGNRASDSNRRKLGIAEHGLVQESKRWGVISAQPIALFTDDDVDRTIRHLGLRFVRAGEDGCQVCCTDLARRDNQLTRCFVTDRPAFDKAIRAGLGAQILKASGLPHSEEDVERTLADMPERFLRIPRIGKKRARG